MVDVSPYSDTMTPFIFYQTISVHFNTTLWALRWVLSIHAYRETQLHPRACQVFPQQYPLPAAGQSEVWILATPRMKLIRV